MVARANKCDMTILNQIQGDEAFGIYCYLTGGADLKSAREIPKKPIHIHEVYPKHDWKRLDNGEIDTWAWESDYHNGPVCQRCYESPCIYCDENYDEEECEIDENRCPSCNKKVFRSTKFCPDCGQAIDWSE